MNQTELFADPKPLPPSIASREYVRLHIVPIELRDANLFVAKHHRHHNPVVGHRFSIGVATESNVLVGVAIVGRPVARRIDHRIVVEVTRVATDGTRNACSALYGASWRIAKEMGYQKIITYTLDSESGKSLRGAGWQLVGAAGGGSWNCETRPRIDKAPTCLKQKWEMSREGKVSSCDQDRAESE